MKHGFDVSRPTAAERTLLAEDLRDSLAAEIHLCR